MACYGRQPALQNFKRRLNERFFRLLFIAVSIITNTTKFILRKIVDATLFFVFKNYVTKAHYRGAAASILAEINASSNKLLY